MLNRKLDAIAPGQLLLVEAYDASGLADGTGQTCRAAPMPQSLVVFDQLGATVGQQIAISEGREAAAPFYPRSVSIDAYCAAILDTIEWNDN